MTLPERGPGLYALASAVGQPGPYRVVFEQREGGQVVDQAGAAFAVAADPELRAVGIDLDGLKQLANRSDGRELRDPAELRQGPTLAPGERSVPLWPWLAGLALALLPLDVAVRRLRWPWWGRGLP